MKQRSSMNRILLVVDMEGCIGINSLSDKMYCKQCVEKEVDYVVKCINDLQKSEIHILDCHNDGTTLDEYCSKNNIPHIAHVWSLDGENEYDMAMLIGFHSKNGMKGILSHTIRPEIDKMYLGNTDIGELRLVENILAYYRIPIVYISGDKTVKDELEPSNYVFCEVKGINLCKDKILENIRNSIKSALNLQVVAKPYDNSNISLSLINNSFLRNIPREQFVVNKNKILFKESLSFISSMCILSEYLNLSSYYQKLRIKRLVSKIKINKIMINAEDNRVQALLNKNYLTLSDNDIRELFTYFKIDKYY